MKLSKKSLKKNKQQLKQAQSLIQQVLNDINNNYSCVLQNNLQAQKDLDKKNGNTKTDIKDSIQHQFNHLQASLPQFNSENLNDQEAIKLGIGIITYNRIDYLKSCIRSIQKFTAIPYHLIVADDGSSDGSIEWCRAQGIPVITGENRGVVWNKNRALYTLMNYTDAECILLLEEDCWPSSMTWASEWCDAISRWHHVNFAHSRILKSRPQAVKGGQGTPEDPYQLSLVTGQCTGCSRHAMTVVGYLDTRFRGYGFGHCEWTQRFLRGNLGGVKISEHDKKSYIYLSIAGGLAEHDAPTNRNQKQLKRNSVVLKSILTDPIYRHPWHNDLEQSILMAEVDESLNFYHNSVNSNSKTQSIKQLRNSTMSSSNQASIFEVIKLVSAQNSLLIGCALDEPKQNSIVDTSSIRIAGWVIGRKSQAVAVEMVCNGQVIHTTQVAQSRPGVGKLYPQKPESGHSGFVTLIAQSSTLVHSEILIQAVLQDKSQIPMYLIRLSSVEKNLQKSSASQMIEPKHLPSPQIQIPQIRQLLLNEYRQMEALLNLHSLIQLSHPLPPLRQWAASPDLGILIYSMVLEKKPQVIVEFGSGSSSLIIGYALQKLGRGQLISLDHDHKFSQLTTQSIINHRLEEYCQIHYAPLRETQIDHDSYNFYSLDKIEDISKIDLLIIDGPPSSTNPLARFPAVPLLYDQLSHGCVIILDDGNRQDEKVAVKKWLQKFEDLKNLPKPQTEKGVSILIKENNK